MGQLRGTLTRDGRLTRAGTWFLRGFGVVLVIAGASEWRALTAVAFGERAGGQVVGIADSGRQREYTATVLFADAAGRTVEIARPLAQPRSGSSPRLAEGQTVGVAFHGSAPGRAVLLHSHENWAGALWVTPLGLVLAALSFVWAPRRPPQRAAVSPPR
jgi:hypothetical protein